MKCKFKVDDCIKVNPDRFPKTMYQSGIPFKVVDIDKKLYILRGLHPDFEGLNIKLLHEYVETKFFKSSCKIGKESPKEVK